ncbi:MAG: hypothetical protein DYG90_06205 [Chloroflexi bacterium CFX6]|nr:hypothetical protein [Chloroflexi bacterium CFX6]
MYLDDAAAGRLVGSLPAARLNVRCMCGAMLGELFVYPNDDRRTGRVLTLPCDQCKYVVYRFVLEKQRPKHELFVLQAVDLDTGRVIPERAQIFVGADKRRRDGTRGGRMVDPRALIDTVNELEREAALSDA